MSEKAQAEAAAFEWATIQRVAEIPRTPVREARPQ